jgi:hypothetical protein
MRSVSMTVQPEKSWQLKARQLDRYRWRLLREHHALAGATLRFARDAFLDFLFGVQARLLLPKVAPTSVPCDILLLQGAPKVIALKRKKLLIETLRGKGYELVESAQEEPRAVIARRLLTRPPQAVPLRYFGYAAYAEWLVTKHVPRLLLNDRNGSLCSPFLRLSLNRRGRPLVHLAHASTVESSRRLGMNDYDYYFLFGQSSLEALKARALRFGNSQAVLSGSHMIDKSYDLPVADPAWRTLLILGVGPDKEKEPGYRRTYELLQDWAAQHPEYHVLVKRHPRSGVTFWVEAASRLPNVTVLAQDCSLAQALEQSSLVVNIMSNAAIESALARRPVLFVNAGGDRDIFSQESYFGPRIRTADELANRVAVINENYLHHVRQAESFAEYHLAYGAQGLERTCELLERLMLNQGIEGAPLCGITENDEFD